MVLAVTQLCVFAVVANPCLELMLLFCLPRRGCASRVPKQRIRCCTRVRKQEIQELSLAERRRYACHFSGGESVQMLISKEDQESGRYLTRHSFVEVCFACLFSRAGEPLAHGRGSPG